MPYEEIVFEIRDDAAWIGINRPEVRNAFREQTLDELADALNSTREDPTIVAAVVYGVGGHLSAGGDFHGMMKLNKANSYMWNDRMQKVAMTCRNLPIPVIAMVEGACVGGGIGNNTCGAHSVIYGKSLDHIMELDVILSDASATHFRPLDSAELEARLSGAGLESEIYRGVRRLAQDNDAAIRAQYPNIMRRVSGYHLDEFLTESIGPYAGSAIPVEQGQRTIGESDAGRQRLQSAAAQRSSIVVGHVARHVRDVDVDEIAGVERMIAVRARIAVGPGIEVPLGGRTRLALAGLVNMDGVLALG